MGREVTRPYRPTVRSDFNESYLSARVTKKKARKRDTLIKKPNDRPLINRKAMKSVQAKNSLNNMVSTKNCWLCSKD